MLKNALLSLLVIFCIRSGYAQENTITFYYRYIIPNYEYGGSRHVTTIDSADYYRVISPPDSGENLYNVNEFYKNGKPKFAGKATANSHIKEDIISFDGSVVDFFPNGKRQAIITYDRGYKAGIEYDYFPNGKLYRRIENKYGLISYSDKINSNSLFLDCYDLDGNMTAKDGNGHWINYDSEFKNIIIEGIVKDGYVDGEWKGGTMDSDSIKLIYQYKKGELVIAKSYDKTGKEYLFKVAAEPATYKNGIDVFAKMLWNRVILPKDENGKKIRDTISVSFIIQKDGHLTDFEVVGHPNPALAAAVLEAGKQSKDWIPRKYYGIPIRSKITIPLDMKNDNMYSAKYTELILDINLKSRKEN